MDIYKVTNKGSITEIKLVDECNHVHYIKNGLKSPCKGDCNEYRIYTNKKQATINAIKNGIEYSEWLLQEHERAEDNFRRLELELNRQDALEYMRKN